MDRYARLGGASGQPSSDDAAISGAVRGECADQLALRAAVLGSDLRSDTRCFHPFQAAPADLTDPGFRRRRAAQFDACLALLDRNEHAPAILRSFEHKTGLQSPFVAWGLLSRELLDLALTCLPAAHLRACFERLLSDIHANRSGLPDLIQFWPHERRYRLIEVKGPGDRLQDNQIRWLEFCAGQSMPVSVCKVSWIESGK
jgi:hypothetical protein